MPLLRRWDAAEYTLVKVCDGDQVAQYDNVFNPVSRSEREPLRAIQGRDEALSRVLGGPADNDDALAVDEPHGREPERSWHGEFDSAGRDGKQAVGTLEKPDPSAVTKDVKITGDTESSVPTETTCSSISQAELPRNLTSSRGADADRRRFRVAPVTSLIYAQI